MAGEEISSTDVGVRALRGEWEEIFYHKFVLEEDVKVHFYGFSLNVLDQKRNVLDTVTAKDGEREIDVQAGCACYIVKGKVKFERSSTDVGVRALRGEWEEIFRHKFELEEDMKVHFYGTSLNVFDQKGNVLNTVTAKDGEREIDVQAGCACYIIGGKVKFERSLTDVGVRALRGEWEEIFFHKFVLEEDMKVHFYGTSLNVLDQEGNILNTVTERDGEREIDVQAGCACYIIYGKVKFERKPRLC